jgi:phospholipase C
MHAHAPNRKHSVLATALVALLIWQLAAPGVVAAEQPRTATPIQHVIVIIGENRTFDHSLRHL